MCIVYFYFNLKDITLILQVTEVKHLLLKSKFTQKIMKPGFALRLILEFVKSSLNC